MDPLEAVQTAGKRVIVGVYSSLYDVYWQGGIGWQIVTKCRRQAIWRFPKSLMKTCPLLKKCGGWNWWTRTDRNVPDSVWSWMTTTQTSSEPLPLSDQMTD